MALNLSGYVGAYKTVEFVVETDTSLISNVLLDDISMTSSARTSRVIPNQLEVILGAVPNTHLTLPTNREVWASVVVEPLKKQTKNKEVHQIFRSI